MSPTRRPAERKRTARVPGSRGRPRPKRGTRPVAPLEWAPRSIDSPLSHYLPPLDLFLEAHKSSVETTRDAAALIDSVRLCYDAKRRIPRGL
jgi:hypothetical protein